MGLSMAGSGYLIPENRSRRRALPCCSPTLYIGGTLPAGEGA